MAATDKVSLSDFTSWNNRLTNIRAARGLGAYNVNPPADGSLVDDSKINELVNKAINSWNSSGALQTRAHWSSYIKTVSSPDIIAWENFPTLLADWEACYCPTNSTKSTNSTNSTQCVPTCNTLGTNGGYDWNVGPGN